MIAKTTGIGEVVGMCAEELLYFSGTVSFGG